MASKKYQEALDRIKSIDFSTDYYSQSNVGDLCSEELDTLQELIDNYSKLSQFDKAVFFDSKNLCVNGITYEQLEKALDKACELNIERRYGNDYLYISKNVIKQQEKELKESLLKEGKKL